MLRKRNNHKNRKIYHKNNILNISGNNKYNNFLSTLDLNSINLDDKKIDGEKKEENKGLNKEEIEELLRKYEDNYNKHFNNTFSKIYGNNSNSNNNNNNLRLQNPNLYVDTNENISNQKKLFKTDINTPFIPRNSTINVNIKKIEKTKIEIDVEINNLSDLINLIEKYKIEPNIEYNINMASLHNIKDSLIELNNMIGMNNLKSNIVEQILYFSQNLHVSKGNDNSGDFMHTVIYGPPGTGKTEIAKIMGKIYSKIGILTSGIFKKVTRSDLIAGYLGQTAIKTKDVIKECLGGVLFIDEAYSLGNNEKRDSFSKECIDTLCEALSDYKNNLMVIIAGYEEELKECFFTYNQGLDSRFTWRFKTDDYKAEELYKIFIKKVKDIGWDIDDDNKIDHKWFESKMDYFKYYGRDIETLLAKTKIAHSKRVFCKPESFKQKINKDDLNKGFEKYINNDEVKKRIEKQTLNKMLYSMYI